MKPRRGEYTLRLGPVAGHADLIGPDGCVLARDMVIARAITKATRHAAPCFVNINIVLASADTTTTHATPEETEL